MKKGISLIVLVIAVIIITILIGIVTVDSSNALVKAEKTKLQVDIVQLEAIMDTYKIRNNGKINFDTTEFSIEFLSQSELKQFDDEKIIDNNIELYIIDLDEIDAQTEKYGNLEYGEKDRYLYSITTGKVYYERGLSLRNVTYYYVENGER